MGDAMTDQIADAAATPETAPLVGAPEAKPGRAHPWTETEARPWRRFFARMLDVSLFGAFASLLIGIVIALTAGPEAADTAAAQLDGWMGRLLGGIVMVVLAGPLIALSIAWTGGTPGKWLMGVRVQRPDGQRLGLGQAFKREAIAAAKGMALGAPLICLFFMNTAREHLEQHDIADWDDDERSVVYRSDGLFQTILTVIGATILVIERLWTLIERVATIGA
jgi:uncharacterized RDD family membrane protein YckC